MRVQRDTYHIQFGAERLLTQYVLSSLDRLDRLLSVCCGDGSHTDSLKTLMLQHLVIIGVDLDTPWLKVLLCPRNLVFSWCESRYEFSFGCAVEEMVGMASAHAAKP
jgi:hypothetical protein